MHIVDAENRSTTIKNVGPGENVSSLLSFVDVATGHPNVYRDGPIVSPLITQITNMGLNLRFRL